MELKYLNILFLFNTFCIFSKWLTENKLIYVKKNYHLITKFYTTKNTLANKICKQKKKFDTLLVSKEEVGNY